MRATTLIETYLLADLSSVVLRGYAKTQDTTPLGVLCSLQVGLQVCPASANGTCTSEQSSAFMITHVYMHTPCKRGTAIVQIFSLPHRKKSRISFVAVLPVGQDGPQIQIWSQSVVLMLDSYEPRAKQAIEHSSCVVSNQVAQCE